MARSTKFSQLDGNENRNYYESSELGYYARTDLQTIIDNFMIAYVGNGKALTKVPRYEVAFHAQRCIQEFSYDMFHAEKTIELELGPALQVQLPQDYVNYVKITRTDIQGVEHELIPDPRTGASQAVVQDHNYQPVQDNTGEDVIADESETIKRWKDNTHINQAVRDYNYQDVDGDFTDNQYTSHGRRYGLTPSDSNRNGGFIIDSVAGIIYFDSILSQDDLIVIKYISDGISNNDDLSNVFVPKLAEDAVYANILYNLTKLRTDTIQLSALYKKEAYAKMKNAKIRLMDLRPAEMKNVFRNKSKWIKH